MLLTTYGIENNGMSEKKAHILESENAVNATNVSLIMEDSLAQRQNFCNIVNSIWDLGIWCEPAQNIMGADNDGDGAIDEDNSLYKTIHGSYPKNENEILLSSFIVDSMINFNVYGANNSTLNLKNREEIIDKEIMINGKKYKVSGYFDCGEIDSIYDPIKENSDSFLLKEKYFNK